MRIQSLISLASLAAISSAATNEPCYGEGGAAGKFTLPFTTPLFSTPNTEHLVFPPCSLHFLTTATGVCISSSSCSDNGGTSISGACPGDAADIKCCTKASCSNGDAGNCRWQSDCAGESVSGQCPGPAQMQCCSSGDAGFGGYEQPSLPAVNAACKQVSVDGASAIIEKFPGRVREIFCARDCECKSGSEHCCGLAVDMMCADGGGVCDLPLSFFDDTSCADAFCTQGLHSVLSSSQLTWDRSLPRRAAKWPSGS